MDSALQRQRPHRLDAEVREVTTSARTTTTPFRVENGLLEVRYDKWPTFNGEFGHVFYKDPFSYYLLAAEYRFVGEQVKRRSWRGPSATTA